MRTLLRAGAVEKALHRATHSASGLRVQQDGDRVVGPPVAAS